MTIYRNYGVTGAEKRSVYTYGEQHAWAVCSDKIEVEIPEGWKIFKNYMDQTMA